MRTTWLAATAAVTCTIAMLTNTLYNAGTFSVVPAATAQSECELVKGIVGAEDITRVASKLYVASSDARLELFEFHAGPGAVASGSLYSIAFKKGTTPTLTKLKLHGFPKDVAFHPHGISYYAPARELAVVNHAYAAGGERIDMFAVTVQGGSSMQLTYKRTVSPSTLSSAHAILNDVVVTGKDELYTTQWLHFPVPGGGLAELRGRAVKLLNLASTLLGLKRAVIWRCAGYNENAAKAVCEPVHETKGLVPMYNGITVSPDGKRILATSPLTRQVLVFNKDSAGALSLLDSIDTQLSLDNIEPDALAPSGEERYTIGSLAAGDYLKLLGAAKGATAVDDVKVQVRSGAIRLAVHPPNSTSSSGFSYSTEITPMQSSDVALSGVSCAVATENGGMLMGSWYADGLLYCSSASSRSSSKK